MVWVLPLKEDFDILVESKGGKVFQKVLNGNVVYRRPQYSTEKRKGVTMNRISEGLLDLARKKFGTLTEAEENLFQKVVNGETADCSDSSEKNKDPNGAKEWDEETRVIRAKCIAWLCTDPEASAMVTHKGIRVKGARIDGELDLEFARISFPLYFEKCAFPGGINIRYAEIRGLFLIGTHTGPIYGDGVKIEGSVYLRNGFKAEGEVRLLGATIGGDLSCIGGQFINKGADALSADRLNVIKGSVFLNNGFKAEGEVWLVGATIGGNLECDGSQFINPGRNALNADGVEIEGGVFLRKGFKADGEVRLLGATIGGDLDCEKGEFINKGARALNGNRMQVEGSVFLRNGFKAEGEVNLIGATIGGVLDCEKGMFINPTGYALLAANSNIKGGAYLRKSFQADGVVSLVGATIDSYLVWTDVNSPEKATLDVRSATVGTLWDDQDSWPDECRLFIHGLVYREIDDDAPRDAKSRIDWLRRQPGFRPQPYEQLAAVLRKSGQDGDAKKILIAKNEDRARLTKLTRSEKWWYRVLGPMIGYGYRPLNALWGVVAFVALGWVVFGIGYCGGLITPQNESAYVKTSVTTVDGGADTRELSDVYPRFNFLVYSFDVFVPLIDLHQAKYWLPNANRGLELLRIKGFALHTGGMLRLYLWVHITMGWAITMLLVAGLTGLIRT